MRSVILNADDFGASAITNAAILRAHTEGVLTSASLMVNEPSALAAVEAARATPNLAVGLHVVVSNGQAALPSVRIPHLVDARGHFCNDPAMAGIRYFFTPAARRELPGELEAQFARFAGFGLPWSHVDGHQHLHMHPVVWDGVVRLCEQYDVRRIRIPYEEFLVATPERKAGRRMEWLFFRALRRRCLRTLARRGFTVADRVYGHLETGRMTRAYVLDLLDRLEGKTNEIYFHPGTPHALPLIPTQDDTQQTPLADVELDALLSPEVRQKMRTLNLHASTYPEIAL